MRPLHGPPGQPLETLPETAYVEIAPDWLCEVLSPTTAHIDRTDKLPLYALNEVNSCWLIDPLFQMLEVLQRHQRQQLVLETFGDDAMVQAPPFAELRLELRGLWA